MVTLVRKSETMKNIMRALVFTTVLAAAMAVLFTPYTSEAYSETDVACSDGITGGAVYIDISTGTVTGCDESVTEVVIPDRIGDVEVTAIGADAFTGCHKLRTVRISAGIKEIAVPAFKDCNSLELIEVDEDSTSFVVDSGALYDINKGTLYKFPAQSGYGGFTVPGYVKNVAPYAFENASNLNSINLDGTSETTMSIGEGCFAGCVNIEYFVFPKYRYNDVGTFSFGDYAFRGCEFLQDIYLPDGVTEIPKGMFMDCLDLKSVNLGQNIERVADDAFMNCPSLRSIDVEYGSKYFSYRSVAVLVDVDETKLLRYPPAKRDEEYTSIPSTVTHICNNAFADVVNLKSLLIPDSVQSFGDNVFTGCSEDLVIRASSGSAAEKYAIENGIKFEQVITTRPWKLSQSITVKSEFSCVNGCAPFNLNAKASTSLSYSSNNPAVADINSNGTVTVKSAGESVITVTAEETDEYKGTSASVVINVENADNTETHDPTLDKMSQSITGGQKVYNKVYGCKPFSLTQSAKTALTYVSSNPKVAAVSKTGTVTVKSGGIAVISIKAEDTEEYYAAESKVTVYVEKASRTIPIGYSSCKKVFAAGGKWTIVLPGFSDYTFKSSNRSIIKLRASSSGQYEIIEMVNPGRATITVTAKETPQYKAATKKISVYTYLKTPQIELRRYSKGKIRITWNAVPGAQKYQVYVYDNAKKKYVLRLTKSSYVKSVLHSGLKAGKTYWYKVRAYRIVDGKRVYSSFSAAKKAVARR